MAGTDVAGPRLLRLRDFILRFRRLPASEGCGDTCARGTTARRPLAIIPPIDADIGRRPGYPRSKFGGAETPIRYRTFELMCRAGHDPEGDHAFSCAVARQIGNWARSTSFLSHVTTPECGRKLRRAKRLRQKSLSARGPERKRNYWSDLVVRPDARIPSVRI